ncbi:hypothetical protein AMAG_09232 [Allomyces macrogynus ATCC 38327]|uniref:AB hydrolase-1 domain-containing protein n=1 Tax=Allomyces macrogynus (strain ATCC 38327) TaxID=578462 RepID=A0A0L0SNW4_ALLM3|nr:hypothetical protein AMAG_09232 [Allomyces macrogynus ATCC 38327]|eukprot:KNE64187.1 hypothetical protein AMAG_09232 [Allomyces macrogynus ATCC 38327]
MSPQRSRPESATGSDLSAASSTDDARSDRSATRLPAMVGSASAAAAAFFPSATSFRSGAVTRSNSTRRRPRAPDTPMPTEETAFVPVSSKITLEARIHHGIPNGRGDGWGVIISHPYARLGGDLDNAVVRELAASIATQLGVPVLRYNMRGVGKSTGKSSLTATAEANDLHALVDWWTLTSHAQSPPMHVDPSTGTSWLRAKPSKIILVGYSYGAMVSVPVARTHPCVKAAVFVSPPSRLVPVLAGFRAAAAFRDPLPPTLPKLFVLGNQDQFANAKHMVTYAEDLVGLSNLPGAVPPMPSPADGPAVTVAIEDVEQVAATKTAFEGRAADPPKLAALGAQVVVVPGADHFWAGEEDAAADLVVRYVRAVISAADGVQYGYVAAPALPPRPPVR